MAVVRIDVDGFSNSSSYNCTKKGTIVYADKTHTTVITSGWSNDVTGASTATQNVPFEFNLPKNSTVVKATVYAKLGVSMYGAEINTINGVKVSEGGVCKVDVTDKVKEVIEAGATSVSIPFVFKSYTVEHNHLPGDMTLVNSYWGSGNTVYFESYKKTHSGLLTYTDVYLLIETNSGYGCLHRAIDGELVPYKFHRVENGVLVPYLLVCTLEPITTLGFLTVDGDALCTVDGNIYKVLGGSKDG